MTMIILFLVSLFGGTERDAAQTGHLLFGEIVSQAFAEEAAESASEYPQVPLGWRKVTLEWGGEWWPLDFPDR